MRGWGRLGAVVAGVALAVAGCGAPDTAGSSSPPGMSPVTGAPGAAMPALTSSPAAAATSSAAPAGAGPDKALVVVEENHTQSSALSGMPYLASLADTYGQTTAYQAVAHPSLPNYLAIIGGSTFGVTDDQPPPDHPVTGDSVLDLAIAKAATAKAYIEDMPGPCTLVSSGDYAVKHNPWAYFAGQTNRRNCQSFDIPAGTPTGGALHDDVQAGTLPTIGMLIPNLCHDAHNCPLATADTWLQQWLPTLMQGPDYRAGHLAIVITFDEDDNSGANTVLTTVIAPTVQHVSAATPLTHYSLTRYMAELSATPPPGEAATAPSLSSAFGL
jgi:phosphatidylinositol-3-phosphatase